MSQFLVKQITAVDEKTGDIYFQAVPLQVIARTMEDAVDTLFSTLVSEFKRDNFSVGLQEIVLENFGDNIQPMMALSLYVFRVEHGKIIRREHVEIHTR